MHGKMIELEATHNVRALSLSVYANKAGPGGQPINVIATTKAVPVGVFHP